MAFEDRRLEPEVTFAPQTVLNGRFRILQEVARGGMGIVYEALDEVLNRRIALKCPRATFQGRLPPEVGFATRITHPNVCRVFELHTVHLEGKQVDFITMEFLQGGTLAKRLKEGPIPEAEARLIARQLCEGLAEAHRCGVIHGDLKASNVILASQKDRPSRAVITDFGLARGESSEPAQMSSDAGGTPDYMAPELLQGGRPSTASDIYALGVILCELASGRRPFAADVAEHARAKSPPPKVHPLWDRTLAGCLEPNPVERLQRAEDVLETLAPSTRMRTLALVSLAVLVVVGAGVWAGTRLSPDARTPVVAVMPFEGVRLPPDSEHVQDGIADGVIHALAQFPGVRVIARTSSFRFRDQPLDPKAVSQALGAAFLVVGRIGTDAAGLTVDAELIDAARNVRVWGDHYVAEDGDVAGLEDRVAREVSDSVGARLSGSPRAKGGHRPVPKAYEFLLRGQYQRRLYTPESRVQAVSHFEQALALDPGYGLAHAEMANIYRLLSGGTIVAAAVAMPKAKAAALRALAADANLAEGHAALADIYKDEWNWAKAEDEYRRAIALNPSLADAHMGYSILLSITGRPELALAESQRLHQLDPVGLPAAIHAAAVHYNARHYAEALKELERARQLDPASPSAWMWTGMVQAGGGNARDAVPSYEKAIALGDTTTATQCFYAYALARSGQREKAVRLVEDVTRSDAFVPPTALAVAYAGLGDADRAVKELQNALTRPDPILQYLKVESHFDSLKDRREYAELANTLGLP